MAGKHAFPQLGRSHLMAGRAMVLDGKGVVDGCWLVI